MRERSMEYRRQAAGPAGREASRLLPAPAQDEGTVVSEEGPGQMMV